MKLSAQNKLKCFIYSIPLIFALLIIYRTNTLNDAVSGYFNVVIFIPYMLLISYLFYNHRYYNNIFVISRYSQMNCQRTHLNHNMKETIFYGLWLSSLLLIMGIKYSLQDVIISIFVLGLIIIMTLIVFALVYSRCLFVFHSYKMGVLITYICIFIYKFVVVWWFEIISISMSTMDIFLNINIIVIESLLCILLYFNVFDFIKNRSEEVIKFIGIIIVSIISHYLLVSLLMGEYSISLYELYRHAVDESEKFLICLYWVIPRLLLVYYCVSLFIRYYNENFIMFATRIKNRQVWFYYIFKKLVNHVLMYCCIDLIYEMIAKGLYIHYIYEYIMNFLYLTFIILALFIIYVLFFDVSIVNSMIYGYLAILFTCCFIDHWVKRIICLDLSINNLIIFLVMSILCIFVVIGIINNKEYYS